MMGLAEEAPYTVVCCHLEGLRSSLFPTLYLTQLAATSSTAAFFRAIVPPKLGMYLDQYRVGGDLLQVLNMAREDRDTFLFRPPVLVKQTERIVAVGEQEAITDFLTFLDTLPPNVLLVFVDEDTAAEVLGKVKAVDRARLLARVVGYTWWARVLKYSWYSKFEACCLEDWWAATFPSAVLPGLRTAPVVAATLMEAVKEVATRSGLTPSSGRFVANVGLEVRCRPRRSERGVAVGPEELEVVNSFVAYTTTSFTVERLDQVVVDDGDGEYFEVMKSEPLHTEAILVSLESEGEVALEERTKKRKRSTEDRVSRKVGREHQMVGNRTEADCDISSVWNFVGFVGTPQVMVLCPLSTCKRSKTMPTKVKPGNMQRHLKKVHKNTPEEEVLEREGRKCEGCGETALPSQLMAHWKCSKLQSSETTEMTDSEQCQLIIDKLKKTVYKKNPHCAMQ